MQTIKSPNSKTSLYQILSLNGANIENNLVRVDLLNGHLNLISKNESKDLCCLYAWDLLLLLGYSKILKIGQTLSCGSTFSNNENQLGFPHQDLLLLRFCESLVSSCYPQEREDQFIQCSGVQIPKNSVLSMVVSLNIHASKWYWGCIDIIFLSRTVKKESESKANFESSLFFLWCISQPA